MEFKHLIAGLALITTVSISHHGNAQINLGGIKNKVKVSKYDKLMKEAQGLENKGDFIEAYRTYSLALEEKSGDYQAKSAQSNIQDKALEQYDTKLAGFIKEDDCGNYKTTIDDMIANVGFTPTTRQKWEDKRDNCEANIKKMKEEAEVKLNAEKNAAKYDGLANGSYFSNGFRTMAFKEKVNISDDFFVNFKMGKTMMEYSADLGLDERHNAYGFFTISVNGTEKAVTGPFHFGSNYSKTWTDFDAAVSLDPKFGADESNLTPMASTSQGMWMISNMHGDNTLHKNFVNVALDEMVSKPGEYKVSVAFGLGKKGEKKPIKNITSGDITVVVDEEGASKFIEAKGPKYMRPLLAEEKAKASSKGSEFGKEHVMVTFDLPQTPKYYNQKWCQEGVPATCDYDHGEFYVMTYLDGKPYKMIYGELSATSYTTDKKIGFIVLPKTDDDMFAVSIDENNVDGYWRLNHDGDVVASLVDQINGGKLSGKHKFTVKVWAEEVVPEHKLDISFVNNATANEWDKFLSQFACFGEGSTEFNVSSDGISAYQSKTYLDVATGRVEKWASTESTLLAQLPATSTAQVKAVIIRDADWNVTYDAFKQPLYRECTADVYYFNKKTNSYRYIYAMPVKADYSGGKFGKPRFTTDVNSTMAIESMKLNPGMNYPVPGNLKF